MTQRSPDLLCYMMNQLGFDLTGEEAREAEGGDGD